MGVVNMSKHPLDLERFIGWLSFALGLSSLQNNDSTFYRVTEISGVPGAWIFMFAMCGISLVISVYHGNVRCRIIWLGALLMLWSIGLALVVVSGPLGAFGGAAIVVVITILNILWAKIHGAGETAASHD